MFLYNLAYYIFSGYFDTLFTNLSLMPGATYDLSLDDMGVKLTNFNILLQFMYSGFINPQGMWDLLRVFRKCLYFFIIIVYNLLLSTIPNC